MNDLVKKVLLSIIVLVIGIFIIEIIYQFFSLDNVHSNPLTKSPTIYNRHKNLLVGYVNPEVYTSNIISSKDSIIIIGDSVEEGLNKTADFLRTITEFEKYYNVVNLAVSGYSTFQEVELLEEEISLYNPKYVVVSYVMNDPVTFSDVTHLISRKEAIKREKQIYDLIGVPSKCYTRNSLYKSFFITDIPFLKKWLLKEHLLNKFIYEGFSGYSDIIAFENNPETFKTIHNYECTWNTVSYSFERLNELSEEYNFSVIVMIFPVNFQETDWRLYYPLEDVHEKIRMEAEKNNFEVIDLLDDFRKYKPSDMRNLGEASQISVIHPNDLAYNITSKKLFELIA